MFVKTSTSIFRTLSANVRHADRGCRFPKSTVNSPLFLSRVGWAVSVSVSTAIGTNPFLNRDFSNFAMYPCASYASPIMDRGHYKRQGQGGAFFNEQVVASRISKSCALLPGISRHVRSDDVISVEHRGEKSRSKVVWIRDSESHHRIRADIHLLKEEHCPWAQP